MELYLPEELNVNFFLHLIMSDDYFLLLVIVLKSSPVGYRPKLVRVC